MIFAIALLITGSGGAIAVAAVAGAVGYAVKKKKNSGSLSPDEEILIEHEGKQTPEQLENTSEEIMNEVRNMTESAINLEEKKSEFLHIIFEKSEGILGDIEKKSEQFSDETDAFSSIANAAGDELQGHTEELKILKSTLTETRLKCIEAQKTLLEKERMLMITLEKLEESGQSLGDMQEKYEKKLELLRLELTPDHTLLQMKDHEIAIKNKEILSLRTDNKCLAESNASLLSLVEQQRLQLEKADAAGEQQEKEMIKLLLEMEVLAKSNEILKKALEEKEKLPGENPVHSIPNLRFF